MNYNANSIDNNKYDSLDYYDILINKFRKSQRKWSFVE